jgi:Flp pilus assembly protein TadG
MMAGIKRTTALCATRLGSIGVARRLQRGVAAIEFAIVFPLFFLLFYGIVTYGLIFVAQQMITLAAEEGARSALQYNPTATPGTLACNTVNNSTQWLANVNGSNLMTCATQAPVVQTCPYDSTSSCLEVTVTYPWATHPLVPILPGIQLVTPNSLTATAWVQIGPLGASAPIAN